MTAMRLLFILHSSILFFGLLSAAHAQQARQADPLFLSDDVLNVRIVADFDTILGTRPVEEYVPGTLSYTAEDGERIDLDIGIRTRGHFRRREDICRFPPLRLNFKKKQVEGTIFDGQDKTKLVTHCRPSSYAYEQAVISEYLAYRVLNLVTDIIFRVRLLRVNYAQTPDDEGFESFAIIIEHSERLAKRIGVPELKIESTNVSNLEHQHMNLMSVFQYFIGNTDFSQTQGPEGAECCHNSVLFGEEDNPPYYPVPYDFDMSGFVYAEHSAPPPELRIESVKERWYRGRCSNNEFLPGSLAKFVDKRPEINALIETRPELGSRTVKELRKFVDEFYRTISSERRVNRYLVGRCR
jgi:hypothetical protein